MNQRQCRCHSNWLLSHHLSMKEEKEKTKVAIQEHERAYPVPFQNAGGNNKLKCLSTKHRHGHLVYGIMTTSRVACEGGKQSGITSIFVIFTTSTNQKKKKKSEKKKEAKENAAGRSFQVDDLTECLQSNGLYSRCMNLE